MLNIKLWNSHISIKRIPLYYADNKAYNVKKTYSKRNMPNWILSLVAWDIWTSWCMSVKSISLKLVLFKDFPYDFGFLRNKYKALKKHRNGLRLMKVLLDFKATATVIKIEEQRQKRSFRFPLRLMSLRVVLDPSSHIQKQNAHN